MDSCKHVRQDAGGAVVVFFNGCIDADEHGDVEAFALFWMDFEGCELLWFEVVVDADEVESRTLKRCHANGVAFYQS